MPGLEPCRVKPGNDVTVSEMTVYSVYEPSDAAPDLEARAEALEFVKEGFSWPAFFVPALWLIYCRMWVEFAVFIVLFGALQWGLGVDRPGHQVLGWLLTGLFALFAFEANDLRGAALERRGYRLIGLAQGRGRTEAELSFFKSWLPQQTKSGHSGDSKPEPARGKDVIPPVSRHEGEDVIGLFPQA